MPDPFDQREVALMQQRIDRLHAAGLPLGRGDIIDARWLATLAALAQSAAPAEGLRQAISVLENYGDHHEWCARADGAAEACTCGLWDQLERLRALAQPAAPAEGKPDLRERLYAAFDDEDFMARHLNARSLTDAVLAIAALAQPAAPAEPDVERLREAIYTVSVRHDWANMTDTEDRTEEIAREYVALAQPAAPAEDEAQRRDEALPTVEALANALPQHRTCDEDIRGHESCLDIARKQWANLRRGS